MNFPSLTSFFKKKKKTLALPESLLVKKLKSITTANDLLVYENLTIYHHASSYYIPLLILDNSRGIYLFEYKDWSYDDLKNAKAEKATNQTSSTDTLAFEKSQNIIKQRFNELTHNDGVPIFNYLLMENLNAEEYEHLDISFQELLPKDKVMFSDSSHAEILQKLEHASLATSLPKAADIMGNLIVQYSIIDNNSELQLCTKEQMDFINAELNGHTTLSSPAGSGKTSAILLKAILEKLKKPEDKIIIIKPTILACDILKKRLLNTIEHAIVEIDITSIEIITPVGLLNKHLKKLAKPELHNSIYIENTLMSKKFKAAELIICDDSQLYPIDFISYLKHIQEKENLLLVSSDAEEHNYTFERSFRVEKQEVHFLQTNQHAKALQLISKLLDSNDAKDILVVSNSLSKEKLNEDLESFIKDKAVLLDSSKNLINQNIENLLLSTYSEINGINPKFIILMDVCFAPVKELEYAFGLAEESVYILYEDDCKQVNSLRKKYESTQE